VGSEMCIRDSYNGNSPRRYNLVYAKNLKLHKGVDNILQFRFLNQEQKAVDISDKEITFRLIKDDGKEILLQKSLSLTLPLNGLCELRTTAGELEGIDAQLCSYSLEIPDNGYDLPVFVNSEAGARGVINVLNSVLPDFVPSQIVTIPSHNTPSSNTVTYYSSVLSTSDTPLLTLQTYMTNYSGNVSVQGSTLPDADWYDIETDTYFDETTTQGYTVQGFHPYVRMKFVSTQGNITQILAR
jgi:hypothetical protein